MVVQHVIGFGSFHLSSLNACGHGGGEQNPQMRKELSLQIRTCHKKELRQWKSEQLSRFLAIPSRWKDLQHFLPKSAGRIDVVRPHENDFSCMLAKFFTGPCELPPPSAVFSEPISTIQEMKAAIQRLKNGKGGDEVGLTAELLKHVPHEFLDALLRLYNDVLYTGEPPASWSKSLFTMLPKKLRAKQVADFRPIANLRLLYKVFAYLLLGRLEHVLDAQQPEEQHGFRAGRRLEEHLLYNFSSTIFLRQSQDDTAAVFAAVQNHSQAGVGVEGWEVLRTKGESKLGMQLLKHHFSTPIKR